MARVGLVLGGGGAVGHGYHGGLLAALEEAVGFDARTCEVIVGTSSGATIAALVRGGLTGADLAERSCREHPSSSSRRTSRIALTTPVAMPASLRGAWAAASRPGQPHAGPVLGALLPSGSVPTVAAGGPLDHLFSERWPEEALWIAAVDVDDGRRVMFGRDGAPATDVPTAVAASCALPGWFTPVVVDGHRYIDGAMWSATNADVLADEGLDTVVVSAPLSGSMTPLHRWQRRHLRGEVRQLRAKGIRVIVIEPTREDVRVLGLDLMDKRRRPGVTRHIRAAMTERLERGDLAEQCESIGACRPGSRSSRRAPSPSGEPRRSRSRPAPRPRPRHGRDESRRVGRH